MAEAPTHEALTELLLPFGVGTVTDAARLPLGEDNENLHVTTSDGDWVVRRYLISGLAKAEGELALVRFLAESGFPTPAPVPTPDGPAVLSDGQAVAVFPFVSGRTPQDVSPGLARQFGELLARMHLMTRDYPAAGLPVVDRLSALTRARDVDRSADPAYAGWYAALTDALAWCADRKSELDALPHGPLHHDLHRENVLVDDDGAVCAVLDFDEVNVGPLILDLCRAVHYLAHESPDLVADDGLTKALLDGYESVRRLSDVERASLEGLFQVSNLHDAAGFITENTDVPIIECKSYLIHLGNPRRFASVSGSR